MNYPLISEYVEAIKAAEDNFEQLKHLRPVLDDDGMPVMSGGNFAVVFKMKDEQTGKLHAVKCFLKEQEGRAEAYRQIAEELEFVSSTFLTPIKYLDKELFVDSANSEDSEFPVLLMDWVEGQTLDKYIREHIDDQYELSLLAYQFSRLAMWLMPQPFAHGDLKPDNILVKEDGTLVLVDYDGMYVPSMKGQKARELGSPDFRHPGRTEEVFDDHIDDFSLACILLSLKAIALQPSLLEEYGASDRLLFSEKDYRNLSESSALGALQPLMQDAELASLYSLFILALSQNNLSQVSFRLFNLKRPENRINLNAISKICSINWFGKYGYSVDKYGAIYSKDKKILFSLPYSVVVYNVADGTEIIANRAFDHFDVCADSESVDISYACLEKLYLPSSVKYITDKAFGEDGHNLKEIRVSTNPNYYHSLLGVFSDRVITQKSFDKVFTHSKSIYDVNGAEYSMDGTSLLSLFDLSPDVSIYHIKEGVKNASGRGISGKGLPEIIIPYGVECIKGFSGNSLKNIVLPRSLKSIEQSAFEHSREITSFEIPEGVETIGQWAFLDCTKLESVVLPSSLIEIGYRAFACNKTLKEITFMGVPSFNREDFDQCPSLTKIVIPKGSMSYFKKKMPEYINALNESNEILSVSVIDEDLKNAWTDEVGAKYSADRKRLLKVPKDIKNYSVKNGTIVICNNAFGGIWLMLSRLSKNKKAESLGVETITIPNTVEIISKKAFYGCSNITSIYIPRGSKKKYEELLPEYKDKLVEISNVVSITFDNSSTSKVNRCRVFKKDNDWKLEIVYKNGMKIEYPHSLLQGNQSIEFDKQTIEKIQLYVGYCEGFYINPKAVKVDFEYPSKFSAKILFDSDFIEISGITWGLNNNINEWKVKGLRSFNIEERLAVNRAEVVPSDYGNSVCFFMNAGGQTYIPLDKNSELCVGDALDMNTAKIITLCRKGKSDIVRVME